MNGIHLGFKYDRMTARGRAYTIGEQPPFSLLQTADEAITLAQYKAVIDWAGVDEAKRWEPVDGKTYCNIYASDMVHILGGYLPRVWWYDRVLKDAVERSRMLCKRIHELEGAPCAACLSDALPAVRYAETVREMGANSLHDWLLEHGERFGWAIVDSGKIVEASQLRLMLNARNTYGLISSRRVGGRGSGHITLAFPDEVNPTKGEGCLQSQAGTYNKRWFKDDGWYRSSRFESTVIAYYRGA